MTAAVEAAVVDTDVVSYLFKGDNRAEPYRPYLVGRELTISFMTMAELEQWALERNWGAQQHNRLVSYLRHYVIHPYDRDLCRWWASVRVSARRNGRPISSSDAWIAATALLYGIPLVTHNIDDYAGVDGLVLLTGAQ